MKLLAEFVPIGRETLAAFGQSGTQVAPTSRADLLETRLSGFADEFAESLVDGIFRPCRGGRHADFGKFVGDLGARVARVCRAPRPKRPDREPGARRQPQEPRGMHRDRQDDREQAPRDRRTEQRGPLPSRLVNGRESGRLVGGLPARLAIARLAAARPHSLPIAAFQAPQANGRSRCLLRAGRAATLPVGRIRACVRFFRHQTRLRPRLPRGPREGDEPVRRRLRPRQLRTFRSSTPAARIRVRWHFWRSVAIKAFSGRIRSKFGLCEPLFGGAAGSFRLPDFALRRRSDLPAPRAAARPRHRRASRTRRDIGPVPRHGRPRPAVLQPRLLPFRVAGRGLSRLARGCIRPPARPAAAPGRRAAARRRGSRATLSRASWTFR